MKINNNIKKIKYFSLLIFLFSLTGCFNNQKLLFNVNIASDIENGKVTSNKDKSTIDEEIVFTITPDANYIFKELTINNKSYNIDSIGFKSLGNRSYSYTTKMVAQGLNVSASFDPLLASIKIIDSEHGSITTSSKESEQVGSSIDFKITSDFGYSLSYLTINNKRIDEDSNELIKINGSEYHYYTTLKEEGITISGTFIETKYDIKIYDSEEVKIRCNKDKATLNEEVIFTIILSQGYELEYFYLNDKKYSKDSEELVFNEENNSYEFKTKMIDGGLEASCSFIHKEHTLEINYYGNGFIWADVNGYEYRHNRPIYAGDEIVLHISCNYNAPHLTTLSINGESYLDEIQDENVTFIAEDLDYKIFGEFKNHEYEEEWKLIKEPTKDESGLIKRKCEIGNEYEEFELPALNTNSSCYDKYYESASNCLEKSKVTYVYRTDNQEFSFTLESDTYGPHEYQFGKCIHCNIALKVTEGFDFTLSKDESYYILSDASNVTDKDIVLPTTYNGKPVKEVGERAFRNYKYLYLESIYIPEGYYCVRAEAIGFQYSLKSVSLPESMKYISIGAFRECPNLSFINIPSHLYYVGSLAFYGCNLKDIDLNIPTSLTNIEDCAFLDSNLKSIKVSPLNPVYDSRNDCNAIIETKTNRLLQGSNNTIVPDNITSIANGAFEGCHDLKSIEIPKGVTEIEQWTFDECTSLSDISIKGKITRIGQLAFNECKSLKSFVVPDTVLEIGERGFSKCNALESIQLPNKLKVIERYLLWECNNLKSIDIPLSVNEILKESFKFCDSLKEIFIPKNVSKIEDMAFFGCNLDDIQIDEKNASFITKENDHSLIRKKDYCLIQGSNQSKKVPSYIDSLGYGAYNRLKSLESIELNDKITIIPDQTFERCESLKSIKLGKKTYSLDGGAFEYCRSLENIELPDTIKFIGAGCFDGCSNLKSIKIPTYVSEINGSTFIGCGLEKVELNNNLESLGNSAFYGCGNLKSIDLPDSISEIGKYCFMYTGLTSIKIPKRVKEIKSYTFNECRSLEYVFIPKSVETIASNAFEDCHHANIYLERTYMDRIEFQTEESAKIYYYSETKPYNNGLNYWHYDSNNNPIPWEN